MLLATNSMWQGLLQLFFYLLVLFFECYTHFSFAALSSFIVFTLYL